MAELADAHGSGPCESNFMEVQVLLSAPPRRGESFLLAATFLQKSRHHFTDCRSSFPKGALRWRLLGTLRALRALVSNTYSLVPTLGALTPLSNLTI